MGFKHWALALGPWTLGKNNRKKEIRVYVAPLKMQKIKENCNCRGDYVKFQKTML